MSGPEDLPLAGVPPEEAIAFFRSKGFAIGFNWQDVFKAEHVRAFTVAKAMKRDLLEEIRAAVDAAIADGTTLEDFQKTLRPKLEARGWWGKKRAVDPATGEHKLVQLGSPRRLKTIFDTNLRTAYAAGKWERIQRTKAAFPFLEYSSMMDGRERPEHHAWDGTILPADDPWWNTHYPPCDWSCRCTAIPRSQSMLDRKGLSVNQPPSFPQVPWTNTRTGETGTNERGIGKGWDYNVGKEYLRGLAPTPLPDSFGSNDEVGAAAELTRPQQMLVDRFLKAFGIEAGKEAIWRDREGWPLAIGRGWFLGANGEPRLPRGAGGVAIDRIAAAIVTPDSIRWIWVAAEDGRQLLMRRYARAFAGLATIVDIGGAGWRWRIGHAGELEQLVPAGYNAHQKRDSSGRFARMNSTAFRAAVADPSLPQPRPLPIGVASSHAKARIAALGIHIRSDYIQLDRSWVRHTLNRHGPGNEDQPGHRPVTLRHIFAAHHAINNAQKFEWGNPRHTRDGNPVIHTTHRAGNTETHVIFSQRRAGLIVHTMYRRKI